MINRRAEPRQAITLKALVHPEQGRSWLCTIKDFCRGGMLLASEGPRSFEASGTHPKRQDAMDIHFTVPTVDGDRHFRLQAFVARVTSDGNGLGVLYPQGMDPLAFKSLDEYAAATGGGLKGEDVAHAAAIGATPEFKINPHDATKVLADLKGIVGSGLPRVTKTFFDSADKDLLVRARDAPNRDDQTRFFDAMNELERCRGEVEASFARAIMDQLDGPLESATSMDRRREAEAGGVGGSRTRRHRTVRSVARACGDHLEGGDTF